MHFGFLFTNIVYGNGNVVTSTLFLEETEKASGAMGHLSISSDDGRHNDDLLYS